MESDDHLDYGGDIIDYDEFIAACINDVIDGYHDLDDDINYDNQPIYDFDDDRPIYGPADHNPYHLAEYIRWADEFVYDRSVDDGRGQSDPPGVDHE